MAVSQAGQSPLVHSLAKLLRNDGDSVLDGRSTLTLPACTLQQLTRLFEQYLLSRSQQHGFLALPSHPADTASLLQLQFLFDVLQKTVSLKIFNPPGSRLQSVVKIFPFKSVRFLEIKHIPPHCLEGLRGVYSQLEAFVCSKSVSSLEELLSLCGGDMSSALPWLELHTLNFSYNSINCLDQSLGLLNVLKHLDLSHNRIQDCAEFLKPLSELEYLNLGYNCLQRAPTLSLSARAKLLSLILPYNELETINGVEQLSSLQHLDLSYNLLLEHSQLAPLSLLHCLGTLKLKGNPLFYHKKHRVCTVRHLSPKAVHLRLKLDGARLTSSEISALPPCGYVMVQSQSSASVSLERTQQDSSSGPGELTESVSTGEVSAARRLRKSKSKPKVRRASISEPSDTDYPETKPLPAQKLILPHQEEIERMSSFREQLGQDWLRYQHHLEEASAGAHPAPSTTASIVTASTITSRNPLNGFSHSSPPSAAPETPAEDTVPPSLLSLPKDQLDRSGVNLERDTSQEDLELDRSEVDLERDRSDVDLEWDRSEVDWDTEAKLRRISGNITEGSTGETPASRKNSSRTEVDVKEDEEGDLGVDLCHPLLVGLLSDAEEEEPGRRGEVFLRVRRRVLQEVDTQRGRERCRLELESLTGMDVTEDGWIHGDKDGMKLPAIDLRFDYISKEKRRRRYVLLDEDPQEALQTLTEVLSAVVQQNRRRSLWRGCVRLQCLRCGVEFSSGQWPDGEQELGAQAREDGQDNPAESTGSSMCPECGSDHVVQIADPSTNIEEPPRLDCSSPCSSTPTNETPMLDPSTPYSSTPINEAPRPDPSTPYSSAPINEPPRPDSKDHQLQGTTNKFECTNTSRCSSLDLSSTRDTEEPTTTFMTAWSSFYIGERRVDTSSPSIAAESQDNLVGSYQYTDLDIPAALDAHTLSRCTSSEGIWDLLSEDYSAVDHRLKLFLDMEVFEEEEEMHSFLKMSAVKYGEPGEVPSLLVVSNLRMYFLEITSDAQGQLSEWLLKRDSHLLVDITFLEVGLGSQSIHVEFGDGAAAYTLLVRSSVRCKSYFGLLTGIVRELSHRSDSKLQSISTTRLSPQHHLWPLLCEDIQDDLEDGQLHFCYLLAFVLQEDFWTPLTILASRETLYLLREDHQWRRSISDPAANGIEEPCSGGMTVLETLPISCVSSIVVPPSEPCRMDLQLYDETMKQETTWSIASECPELLKGLLSWVRTRWESMFGVKLCLQERAL